MSLVSMAILAMIPPIYIAVPINQPGRVVADRDGYFVMPDEITPHKYGLKFYNPKGQLVLATLFPEPATLVGIGKDGHPMAFSERFLSFSVTEPGGKEAWGNNGVTYGDFLVIDGYYQKWQGSHAIIYDDREPLRIIPRASVFSTIGGSPATFFELDSRRFFDSIDLEKGEVYLRSTEIESGKVRSVKLSAPRGYGVYMPWQYASLAILDDRTLLGYLYVVKKTVPPIPEQESKAFLCAIDIRNGKVRPITEVPLYYPHNGGGFRDRIAVLPGVAIGYISRDSLRIIPLPLPNSRWK